MATKWQRFSVDIPKALKPEKRREFAQDVIDHIYKRSKENKSSSGRADFPIYSRDYAKFKGTSRANVNLVLSDTMLKAMKLISHKPGRLLIGYENGTTQNAKADGNQRGTYGKPSPIPGKARKFMGITQKALKNIEKKYKPDVEKEVKRISKEVVEGIR